jgi:monoamine oxidase
VTRIAVIGAGAAGISAARTLRAAGVEVVVYEARDRAGGRVWTDTSMAPHPVELGAEFVHGERVATWDWIREFDAPTTGAAHAYEMWFHHDGHLLDREAANVAFGTDPLFAIERLTRHWTRAGRPEASLDRVLELWPETSQRPLTEEGRKLIANYVAELAASDLEQLGTHRAATPQAEEPERLINFRLLDGYSSLIARAVAGLEIKYETPVARLRWDDGSVEVSTRSGLERFDRAIVTLPLGVLRRETVEFEPALPRPKREAIERINAGHISKVVLRFDEVYWPQDMTFLWTPQSTQLWWRPGQGQQAEAPVVTAFFGGSAAAALEDATPEEAIAEATQQLEQILGRPLRPHLLGGRYIAWGREPHTWMGYSSLPPGGSGLRESLAAPVGVLHFAGEATSLQHAATVHGAIESGKRAALEVLAARPPASP